MATPEQRTFLEQELSRWLEQGLIDAEQKERILAHYPKPAVVEKRRVAAWLPAILIGMAVLLIGVGLVLFYAANWRKMAPALKLVQILGLLVLIHGGTFMLLFGRRPFPLAGRGLLVLGMIAYGAAIGLVAQTYHISAHPTNGLLLWLGGVIALSAVMRERIGYYFALLLALVWHCWEFGAYDNINLPFLAVLALLAWLLFRAHEAGGLLIVGLQALLWVFLANALFIERARDSSTGVAAFLLLQIPLGVCLIALDRLPKPAVLRLAGTVGGALGWLCLFTPLIALSWPMKLGDGHLLFFCPGMTPLLLQHLLFSGAAGGLLLRLRVEQRAEPRGKLDASGLSLLGLGLLYGLATLLLPLGLSSVRLVFTHLGLIGLILGLLLDGHRSVAGRSLQRALAFFCAISALFIKGGVFLIMGEVHPTNFVAYALGAVIFTVVIFLCNRCVPVLLARQQHPEPHPQPARYRQTLLDALCALAAYLLLYAASFQLREQSSVLAAETVVLILLAVFVALGIGLYAFLWKRSPDRLPLALSAVIFGAAVVLLLVAGPSIPWQLYSVAFNLLLLALQGLLLLHATRVNSIALANLVMVAFVLHIGTRYFDIFWDLLSGSLLFIVTGVVVFAGGFLLERNRRRLVRHIRETRT